MSYKCLARLVLERILTQLDQFPHWWHLTRRMAIIRRQGHTTTMMRMKQIRKMLSWRKQQQLQWCQIRQTCESIQIQIYPCRHFLTCLRSRIKRRNHRDAVHWDWVCWWAAIKTILIKMEANDEAPLPQFWVVVTVRCAKLIQKYVLENKQRNFSILLSFFFDFEKKIKVQKLFFYVKVLNFIIIFSYTNKNILWGCVDKGIGRSQHWQEGNISKDIGIRYGK